MTTCEQSLSFTASVSDRPQPDYSAARVFCALAIFTALFGSTTPSAIYPLYVASMSIGHGVATAIFASYTIGALVSLRLSSCLSSRSRQPCHILLPAVALLAIGAVMMACASSASLLFVGRFVSGLGTGAITGVATAAIYDLSRDNERERGIVLATIAFTAGAAIGPIASAAAIAIGIAPTVVAYLPVIFFSIVTLAGLALCRWPKRVQAVVARQPNPPAMPVEGTGNSFLISMTVLSTAWMIACIMMAVGSATALSAFDLHSAALTGLLPAVFQLSAGTGQYLFGRSDERRAMIMGSGGLVACQIVMVGAVAAGSVAPFAVAAPLSGFFYGATFVGVVGFASRSVGSQRRASLLSDLYLMGYLLSSLPTVALGVAADRVGVPLAFSLFSIATAALAGLGNVLCWRVRLPASV